MRGGWEEKLSKMSPRKPKQVGSELGLQKVETGQERRRRKKNFNSQKPLGQEPLESPRGVPGSSWEL